MVRRCRAASPATREARRGAGTPHAERRRRNPLLNRRPHRGELLRRVLAEQTYRNDAHDGDQSDEQGVLNQAGSSLRPTEACPKEGGKLLPELKAVHREIHRHATARSEWIKWLVAPPCPALRRSQGAARGGAHVAPRGRGGSPPEPVNRRGKTRTAQSQFPNI